MSATDWDTLCPHYPEKKFRANLLYRKNKIEATNTFHFGEDEKLEILYMDYNGTPVEFQETLLFVIPRDSMEIIAEIPTENSGGIPYRRNSVDTLGRW
jgi:hypothetical protein